MMARVDLSLSLSDERRHGLAMARVLPMAGVRPGAHHEVATLGRVGNEVGHALGARVVWALAVGAVRGHVIVGAREDMAPECQ